MPGGSSAGVGWGEGQHLQGKREEGEVEWWLMDKSKNTSHLGEGTETRKHNVCPPTLPKKRSGCTRSWAELGGGGEAFLTTPDSASVGAFAKA